MKRTLAKLGRDAGRITDAFADLKQAIDGRTSG